MDINPGMVGLHDGRIWSNEGVDPVSSACASVLGCEPGGKFDASSRTGDGLDFIFPKALDSNRPGFKFLNSLRLTE